MPPRLYVDSPLETARSLDLPSGPARHVQVLRLQPGAALTLFDGQGGEWRATIERIGRSEVTVRVGEHDPVDRELPLTVTVALGMPANERMDLLVEKATELGVASIQPLVCQRSVLRLSSERAQKKVAHWQAVAVAACEQCGRTRVPTIEPVQAFDAWLAALPAHPDVWPTEGRLTERSHEGDRRVVLSFDGTPWSAVPGGGNTLCLSGPEGGLTDAEESAARRAGFAPLSLGSRVLRADTAPLALLAHLAVSATTPFPAPSPAPAATPA